MDAESNLRRLEGAGWCKAARLPECAKSSNSRLANPNACSTLLLPMAPQSLFISTVEALQ